MLGVYNASVKKQSSAIHLLTFMRFIYFSIRKVQQDSGDPITKCTFTRILFTYLPFYFTIR